MELEKEIKDKKLEACHLIVRSTNFVSLMFVSVTGLRGKTTSKMSKDDDEDLWGSVAAPAPRATSQPSNSRANRTVNDDDPWAAIAAPAPSAKPLNVKRSGALDDNDPWAAIAAPVPTAKARPSVGRGRGNKPTVPKLGAQRINRTSSGM